MDRTEYAVKLSLAGAALPMNLLIILAHVMDPLRVFGNPSSMFVLNITVIDCSFSVLWLIYYALFLAECSEFTQSVYAVHFVDVAVRLATMTGIAYSSLALELYFSIARPLWHRVKLTHKVCRSWIIATWVLHLTLHELTTRFLFPGSYKYFFIASNSLIFFSVIQWLNLATFLSLRKQGRALGERRDVNETTLKALRRRQANEKRFFVTIAISNILVAISYTPYIVFGFLFTYKHALTEISQDAFDWLDFISHDLIFFHAIVKPFFYIWRLPKYEKTLKQLWGKCLG